MSDQLSGRFDQLKNTPILSSVKRRVGEIGLALTIYEELESAGIHFDIDDNGQDLSIPGQPVLAVGDHSQGLESLLIVGVSGALDREDVSVTAKPYALTGQVVNALAEEKENHLIGLIPGNMAKGRRGGDFGTRAHRAVFRNQLLTKEEIRAYNDRSMKVAASALDEDGRLVTVFPTGGVYNAAKAPWREGVGQLAARLSPEGFDETIVAPFAFKGVSPRRILQAILMKRLGREPKTQSIKVTLGQQDTLGKIFHNVDDPSPAEITSVLQGRYQDEFTF